MCYMVIFVGLKCQGEKHLKQMCRNLDFTKTQPDVNLQYIASGFAKFVIFPITLMAI